MKRTVDFSVSDSNGVETEVPSKLLDRRSRECPYLDTINRSVLDFDFEKLCSVSLSNLNVYACIICGKYFQGKRSGTHAYTHSVQLLHHVFINLDTQRFYCLPDNYEVIDSCLDDIKYVLNPTYSRRHILSLDSNTKSSRAFDGTIYLPGVVGLNNIKANDYFNVVMQCLSLIPPLRNYFLEPSNYNRLKSKPGEQLRLLSQRFGEAVRKIWNPNNFKAHVSPHEMLQAVVLCSEKRFQITQQADPIDLLSWFLNSLHLSLNGKRSRDSSVVYRTFQGSLRCWSQKILPVELDDSQKRRLLATEAYRETVTESSFLYLTMDIPPPPLFKAEIEENIIPQVPLYALCSKFDGVTNKEYKTFKDNSTKRYQLTHLPPYLIIYLKRFIKNNFFVEKNNTIVNFPIKGVDFGELLVADEDVRKAHPNTTYDLVANIVHDGEFAKGTYRCHILHKGTGKWFEVQDLHVQEVLPQMITLSESYIQFWELQTETNTPS